MSACVTEPPLAQPPPPPPPPLMMMMAVRPVGPEQKERERRPECGGGARAQISAGPAEAARAPARQPARSTIWAKLDLGASLMELNGSKGALGPLCNPCCSPRKAGQPAAGERASERASPHSICFCRAAAPLVAAPATGP